MCPPTSNRHNPPLPAQAEGQILAARSLLGPYARIVASVCHNLWGAKGDARVYPAALLALTKLMIVDATFCDMKVRGAAAAPLAAA